MRPPKETILRALSQYRGDNLERARMSFRGMSPQQMLEPFGRSGMTRAEVLAEYEALDAEVDAAVAVAKSLP